MRSANIDVIIPAFNAAHCIRKTLDSVLQQTMLPKNVFVVDDGSTDSMESVVRSFTPAVTYLRQENAGPSAARNAGVRHLSSSLCAFLDADDLWEPTFLERCAKFLANHPQAIAVSTAQRYLLGDGLERIGPKGLLGGATEWVLEDFFDTWGKHDHVRTGSAVFRTEAMRRSGGFREDLRIAEDLELWGYLGTMGQWGFIAEPLWVGNSVAAAAKNWHAKLIARARHCPTVATWQVRLVGRVQPVDLAGFAKARGRVAASIAYLKVLLGDWPAARECAEIYLADMPFNRFTRLLRIGMRFGAVGGFVVRILLSAHETSKAARLRRRFAD